MALVTSVYATDASDRKEAEAGVPSASALSGCGRLSDESKETDFAIFVEYGVVNLNKRLIMTKRVTEIWG